MDGNAEKAPPSPSRVRRNLRRAMEWRKKKEERRSETPKEEIPGPSANIATKPSEHTPTAAKKNIASKFVRWIRGETLHFQPTQDPPNTTDTIKEDPKALYESMEINTRLARLEEAATLTAALRHLVRHTHPRGKQIGFPVPGAVDRIQLKCCNLPTDPEELRKLVEMVFRRREEPLDIDELYRDFAITHGRIITDMTQPYPACYGYTRHP